MTCVTTTDTTPDKETIFEFSLNWYQAIVLYSKSGRNPPFFLMKPPAIDHNHTNSVILDESHRSRLREIRDFMGVNEITRFQMFGRYALDGNEWQQRLWREGFRFVFVDPGEAVYFRLFI